MEFLPTSYVVDYVKRHPKPLNELGEFVYYRTYSRWLPNKGRREYWHETIKRAIEYNMALEYKHLKTIGMKVDLKRIRTEAKKLFINMYNTKQFPSGRTLWIGNANAKVNEHFVLGNFNCSFLNISKWEDLGDLFYLLLVGTGVGFKSTKALLKKMPKIRTNTTLIHSEYEPVPKEQRLEETELHLLPNGFAKIFVGDSKEGWVESLRYYFRLLTEEQYEDIHTIKISYNSVRPKGERLLTFGGTASGYEPLRDMYSGIDAVFKNSIDSELEPIVTDEKGYGRVRAIHILDIGNLVGAGVIVGGVRRTAEIFLMDADDHESMLAKYGMNGFWKEAHFQQHEKVRELLIENNIKVPIWFDELGVRSYDADVNKDYVTGEANREEDGSLCPYNFGRSGITHRRMSNNSVAFEQKPTREQHSLQFGLLQGEGEPCFVNLEEARRRRPNAEGLNPCVEIILDSYGVCNLTTINVTAFIVEVNGHYFLDIEALKEAQRLSARIGLRQTLATLELPHWNAVQQRDRLIGTSLTGWKDAMVLLDYNAEQEVELMEILKVVSRDEADTYAKYLRVASPLLAATVKPEGTLSQVARNPITGSSVSSGLHMSHAPYFIRRVRISSKDPLALVAKDLGWTIHAEVGTIYNGVPCNSEDLLATEELLAVASTWVVDFPTFSGSNRSKSDTTVREQFNTYFNFMEHYVEHNASNTIDVKNADEWKEAEEIVWENWDNFVGVSFLASDGGTYKLAPYETITEEKYHELKAAMQPFDPSLLHKYEESETDKDLENMTSCESGVCPIF